MDVGLDGQLWSSRNGRSGKLSHSNSMVDACTYTSNVNLNVNVCSSTHFCA